MVGARARFVGCGTGAPVSLDGKLRIHFGKSANPMVLHLSGMCVSHRDTPVPIEDTTLLQPSPSRWQVASLREDARAHTIHLFVFKTNEFGCSRACTHQRSFVHVDFTTRARALLCRQMAGCGFILAGTRIRWSFTCLVCVSVTATRPCPSRTRHYCNRRPHCGHRRRRRAHLRVTTRTDSRN